MFCEKCGKKLNDGEVFCESCGHKVGENSVFQVRHNNKNVLDDLVMVLKFFLQKPLDAIKMCGKTDYMIQGVIFIAAKCIIVSLLFVIFKTVVVQGIYNFYWLMNINAVTACFVMLFILAIGDVCWIGIAIGCCRSLNDKIDIRNVIGVVGIAQVYVPAIVIIGIMITAVTGYSGSMFMYIVGIVTISLLQYEGIQNIIGGEHKNKGLIFFTGALCIYMLIWFAIIGAVGNIYGFYI